MPFGEHLSKRRPAVSKEMIVFEDGINITQTSAVSVSVDVKDFSPFLDFIAVDYVRTGNMVLLIPAAVCCLTGC